MTPRQVVENYWEIESRRDLEGILGCYGAKAELQVPGLGRLIGHDQIRTFYQQSIAQFPHLEVAIVGALESGNRGVFEWKAIFHDHAGRPVRLKGVNVVRVADDLFQEVHVYFDPSELAA